VSERDLEYRMAVRTVLAAIVFALALTAFSAPASAQALDRYKPAAISAPISGLYIDQTAPQRYCVIERGRFGQTGERTFLHCAAGFNNAGHTFSDDPLRVGREYLLYRLQADGGLLAPVVLNSVTITDAPNGEITVRFGSPGAQSPPYTLVLQ
jgi:hypothetical protein